MWMLRRRAIQGGGELGADFDGDERPDLVKFGIGNGNAAVGPVDWAMKAAEPTDANRK